jgi:hypothetical protein
MKDFTESNNNDPAPSLDAEILRGRQSVRATFRLPPAVIELLSLAASQLGIKQKSLFDQLIEDRQVLAQVAALMADTFQSNEAQPQRQQKTYVVSRSALLSLEHVAKTLDMPRDLLVEISISRLLPVISSEQEKLAKRKVVLAEIEEHLGQGQGVLQRAEEMLGTDDAAVRLLAQAVAQCGRVAEELRGVVAKGRAMERYQ